MLTLTIRSLQLRYYLTNKNALLIAAYSILSLLRPVDAWGCCPCDSYNGGGGMGSGGSMGGGGFGPYCPSSFCVVRPNPNPQPPGSGPSVVIVPICCDKKDKSDEDKCPPGLGMPTMMPPVMPMPMTQFPIMPMTMMPPVMPMPQPNPLPQPQPQPNPLPQPQPQPQPIVMVLPIAVPRERGSREEVTRPALQGIKGRDRLGKNYEIAIRPTDGGDIVYGEVEVPMKNRASRKIYKRKALVKLSAARRRKLRARMRGYTRQKSIYGRR